MRVSSIILLALIAALSGSVGTGLAGYKRLGCLGSIALGFIGAYLEMVVADKFHLPILYSINVEGHPFPIVWALISSALFASLMGLLGGSRRRRKLIAPMNEFRQVVILLL